MTHAFSLQRLLNTPLALLPERAAMLVAAVHSRFNITALQTPGMVLDASAMHAMSDQGRDEASRRNARRRGKSFDQAGPIAIIPVYGTLTKTYGLDPESGMTGYDGIETKLMDAMADDSVRAIWLDVDSGGGDVNGLFGLVDLIYNSSERRGGKLIVGMAADDAYSAAYAIASAADIVAVPRTGGVGSVGVITLHAERSKQLEQDGITVTVIRSGQEKARFNSVEPLDDAVRARVQAEMDEIRTIFVDTVARNRDLSAKIVSETEGLTYMGRHARAIGFVNEVASEQEMFARLLSKVR